MKNEKKQSGRVNYAWVLAGGYGLIKHTSDLPAVGIIGGVVFTAFGGWLLWREWKVYKFALDHKDDPSTWSDDPETAEEEDEG